MNEINFVDTAYLSEIASISQNQYQHDNYSITVYTVPSDYECDNHNISIGDYIVCEDAMTQSYYYKLDVEEVNDFNVDRDKFLKNWASEWVSNMGADSQQLERLQWGIISPSDLEVTEDYSEECVILVERCMAGYYPYEYVTDEDCNQMFFDNAKDAQYWINKKEADTYYLQHNEQGRPTYTIVATD